MKLINNFLVGSDVEFFLVDKQTGKPVSAEGLVKGSKDEPYFLMKAIHILLHHLTMCLMKVIYHQLKQQMNLLRI